MTLIEWEEPPVKRTGRLPGESWSAIADALKARPNEWACVRRGASAGSFTNRIRWGGGAFAPAGAFESVSRSVGKDAEGRCRYDVYARYVGGEQS